MATREIVELPDRKSGDINEIRDKKIALAKDATAQSDLPQQLEYLIKNGQTGEFMNVLDSYINEKIRSALGSLIASLDKGAAGTTKAIACIDTNNDLGIINPANLASVLGGTSYVGIFGVDVTYGTAISDINSVQNGVFGIYSIKLINSNFPNHCGILIKTGWGGAHQLTAVIDCEDGKIYTKYYTLGWQTNG